MDRQTQDDFSALDLLGCSVFVVDQDPAEEFHIIYLNKATRSRLGAAADGMIGPVRSAFPSRMADRLIRNYEAAMQSEEPVVMNEVLAIEDFDGHWRTILTVDPDRPRRIIGSVFETTDLEARALTLSHKLAESHARLEEMRTMAGLTAHDTRAPLANVISLLDIVLEDFSDLGDGKPQMLTACQDVATAALESIESLMSRIGSTAASVRGKDRIDIGQLCRQIAAIVDPVERLRIVHPEGTVVCDQVILQAALRNLVDNAARYAKSRIEITIQQSGTGTLDVIIADDGSGFSESQLSFGPEDKVASVDGGRGYGLPAIAQLLNSHSGSLKRLPSRMGNGATLRIRLPGKIEARELYRSA